MSQRYCTNCGERLEEGVAFCTNCGAAVEAEAPTPPIPSTVTPSRQTTASITISRPSGISTNAVIGGIAVIAALLAVVYFALLRPSSNTAADIPYPDVVRTSVEDAYARFEEGSALFMDVRDRDSYTTMHIPDAVWMLPDDVEARLNELPPGVEILTYCT